MTQALMDIHGADATARQKDLIGRIRELGHDRFRPRAAELDARNLFPFENYADLREAGFYALTIPEDHGGMGADYGTYALVSAELGRWCPATALTFNMHAATLFWASRLADELDMPDNVRAQHNIRRADIFRRVVEDGMLFAQPFSEPDSAAAAGKAAFGTMARPVEGGYRVDGIKHFASLSGAASHYGLVCTLDEDGVEPIPQNTMFLAVPADAEGVTIFGEWDVMGMRPTDSRSLKFDNVFVPDALTMLPHGLYYQAALNWPHMFMTLTPTYLGLAHAAFQFTVDYLRGEVAGAPPAGPARHSPAKQLAVAEMRIKLEQATALFRRAVGEARLRPTKEDRLRAYATQFTVMEYANDIARLGLRTCGGRAIFRNFDIERWYRDSRCGSLMLPWTAEICLERLGRESLFERGER